MGRLPKVAALSMVVGFAVAAPASAAPKPLSDGSWTCTGQLSGGRGEQQMIIFGADTQAQAVEQARQAYSQWSQISCVPQ